MMDDKVKSTRTRRKPRRSNRRIAELVLDISHKVAMEENLDDQLRIIVEEITQVTGSERGSLFLNDPQTDELYSRIALGGVEREIRFLNNTGIAGWVFTEGKARIVKDAYDNPHFNKSIDQKSGFTTRNILCVPVRTVRGDVIGVAQTLNKVEGDFTEDDLALVQAISTQVAIVLQGKTRQMGGSNYRGKITAMPVVTALGLPATCPLSGDKK
jgi:adenylate cyclase